MEQPDIDLKELRELHKQRRELTAFYQGQVTALHAAPIQAWSTITLLVSVTALMFGTGIYSPTQKMAVILSAVAGGIGMATWVTAWGRKDARSIQNSYLRDHELLFPGHQPIALTGFLLPNNLASKTSKPEPAIMAGRSGEP